jgi:hypothetical protein
MRIRPWVAGLAGAALLGCSVAFFAITTVRHDQLRRDGTRTTANVVHTAKRTAWPLLNSGRVTVRYTTPQGTFIRSIWLDDTADMPHGRTWTVIYDPHHPGRVRSLTDGNDPYPWLAPFLLVGLIGVIAMISRFLVRIINRLVAFGAAVLGLWLADAPPDAPVLDGILACAAIVGVVVVLTSLGRLAMNLGPAGLRPQRRYQARHQAAEVANPEGAPGPETGQGRRVHDRSE